MQISFSQMADTFFGFDTTLGVSTETPAFDCSRFAVQFVRISDGTRDRESSPSRVAARLSSKETKPFAPPPTLGNPDLKQRGGVANLPSIASRQYHSPSPEKIKKPSAEAVTGITSSNLILIFLALKVINIESHRSPIEFVDKFAYPLNYSPVDLNLMLRRKYRRCKTWL